MGITIPILKREKKNTRKSGPNSIMELFASVIRTKISGHIQMSEEQQWFRKNVSTIVAIFTVRQIIQKLIKYNKPPFTCF